MIGSILFTGLISFISICSIQTNRHQTNDNSDKPNILIIMADDCTYNDLALYGGVNVETPEIDKLASEGMTFNKAFVTMSMCTPCRAELFTGMYPVSNGVNWNHGHAKKGIRSIVHHLGDAGYKTGIAGKVHNEPEEVFPFEMVEGVERNCVSETAEFSLDGMREFMSANKSEPFCLVAALVVPHIPWTVGDSSNFNPEDLVLPPYLADTKETRKEFTNYLAEIEVLDQQVGALLNLLKEEEIDENTIVIFTSEQGAQFPFCKWTNWNMGVHTGFIVRWPGNVDPGTRSDALIQYADVLPTLVDAVGGELSNNFDGSSFLNVLKGENDKHREYAYFMHNNVPEGPSYPIRSVTDGTYHYIRNLDSEKIYIEKHLMSRMPLNNYWPSWVFESAENEQTLGLVNRYMRRPYKELYNLKTDPNELLNLAEKKDLITIKMELEKELDKWMKAQGDPGIGLDTHKALNESISGKNYKK